jgi:hypothetical protein
MFIFVVSSFYYIYIFGMSLAYWEEMGAMWLVVEVVDVEKEDCVLISSSSSCAGCQWPSSNHVC